MRLISCLNPKVVKNPYTGEKVACRCGKCAACLNARSANWVQRIKQEIQDNKYTVFATLQYDEQHVPQMIRLRKEDDPHRPSYIDSLTGEIISLHDDSVPSRSKKDYDYCYDTKVLLVHNNRDIPLFMKRLRYYFNELTKNEPTQRIRHYIALEYGPQTYRPHAHCLFFFNSSLFAQNFEELLNKAWKYGRVFDPHIISGYSAANYVASYVNSTNSLPSIYLHKSIRQRTFFSKFPAIGTLSTGVEQVKKIFDSAAIEQQIYDASCNQFRNVPLWPVFQHRLFPRVQRFDSLSHSDRVTLYRQAETGLFRCDSAVEIARRLESIYIKNAVSANFNLVNIPDDDKKVVKDTNLSHFKQQDFFALYLRNISSKPVTLHTPRSNHYFKEYNFDSLVRFVRIVNRVAHNAASFGVSIEFYVSQIENYYEKREKSNYLKLLGSQQAYLEEHPKRDLILTDVGFLDRVNGKDVHSLSDGDLFYLKYYGVIDDDYQGTIHLSIDDAYEYQNLRQTHEKVFWDNSKNKSRNDYLFSQSSKFKNIINYKLSENL